MVAGSKDALPMNSVLKLQCRHLRLKEGRRRIHSTRFAIEESSQNVVAFGVFPLFHQRAFLCLPRTDDAHTRGT